MTFQTASRIFLGQYPKRKILGYWDHPKGIVLQVSPALAGRAEEPCQFLVTSEKEILPTNPAQTPELLRSNMKRV